MSTTYPDRIRSLLARSRTILDRAEAENRDLSPEESEQVDAAQHLATAYKLQRALGPGPSLGAMMMSDPSLSPWARSWTGGEDPREARALAPDESAVSYLERRGALGDSAARELGIGRYLAAMYRGPKTAEERAALAEGSDATGGYTVPALLEAQLIDIVRAQSTVIGSGAGYVPLDSDDVSYARVSADPSPSWRLEGGSVSESEPTFDRVQFVPKSCAFVAKASREIIEDASNLNSELPLVFGKVMAQEMDRVALLGDSANNEPVGLFNASNISEVDMGTNGAAISDYTDFLSLRQTIHEANGDLSRATCIYAPRTGAVVEAFADSTGQPLQRPPALQHWTFKESSKVPTDQTHGTANNASFAAVGGFAGNLMIGQRLGVRIEPLRERYADNLQIGFLVYMRMDVQFMHPALCGRIVGIIP